MFKSSFAVSAVAFLLAAPAALANTAEMNTHSFTYEGVKYVYTAEQKGDLKVLKGTSASGKVSFELRVGKRNVTGYVNDRAVTFNVKDVKPIAKELAMLAE